MMIIRNSKNQYSPFLGLSKILSSSFNCNLNYLEFACKLCYYVDFENLNTYQFLCILKTSNKAASSFCFGRPCLLEHVFCAQLRYRIQGPWESLQQLVLQIENFVRKAYPYADANVIKANTLQALMNCI